MLSTSVPEHIQTGQMHRAAADTYRDEVSRTLQDVLEELKAKHDAERSDGDDGSDDEAEGGAGGTSAMTGGTKPERRLGLLIKQLNRALEKSAAAMKEEEDKAAAAEAGEDEGDDPEGDAFLQHADVDSYSDSSDDEGPHDSDDEVGGGGGTAADAFGTDADREAARVAKKARKVLGEEADAAIEAKADKDIEKEAEVVQQQMDAMDEEEQKQHEEVKETFENNLRERIAAGDVTEDEALRIRAKFAADSENL